MGAGEKAWFVALANFHDVNTPTMVGCKLPAVCHWTQNWEENLGSWNGAWNWVLAGRASQLQDITGIGQSNKISFESILVEPERWVLEGSLIILILKIETYWHTILYLLQVCNVKIWLIYCTMITTLDLTFIHHHTVKHFLWWELSRSLLATFK